MLSRLLSVLTNLCISFQHQSGVLLHKGTTLEELLLSSQIENAMEKNKTKVSLTCSLTKCQPDPKPHPGGLHLTRGQPNQSSNTLGHKLSQRSDKNVNLT